MAQDINSVSALREALWAQGFRPVPVINAVLGDKLSGKRPIPGNGWQIEAQKNPPFCAVNPAVAHALNTGIDCTGLLVADFDLDDPLMSTTCQALAVAHMGWAPVRRRPGSSRCLMPYAVADEGQPRSLPSLTGASHTDTHGCKIEVLGKGRQFVAYGSHYSGADLEWSEDLSRIHISELSVVTEAQVHAFLVACAAVIDAPPPGAARQAKPNEAGGNGQDHEPSDLHAEAWRIASAMAVVPNDAPPNWEQWNTVGMAIWAATQGSEEGWVIFRDWSARNPAYDEGKTRARWDHYPSSPPTRIGAGTLFRMANLAGWGVDHLGLFSKRQTGDEAQAAARPGVSPGAWTDRPHDFTSDPAAAVPELTADHIPEALAGFVFDTAARMGVDPVSVALSGLVCAASVMSDHWVIQPKRFDHDWTESPRLWGAILGPPSVMKSPVVAVCSRPIDWLEMDARREHDQAIENWKPLAAAAQKAKEEEPPKPKLVRYMVESTTIEALSEVLRSDPEARFRTPANKVLVRQDEMAEFFANLDRYTFGSSKGGDSGAYLRLFNGGRFTVDRIRRGSFTIANWSANFLGGMQPGPIQRIAKQATEDGLLQRFCFAVPGEPKKGEDRAPDDAAIGRYHDLFPVLAGLHAPRSMGGNRQKVALHADAHAHREAVDERVAALLRLPDALPQMAAALGKWRGLFARLSLIFHLIDLASGKDDYPTVVSERTARRVRDFMLDILLPHLQRAYRMMFRTHQASLAELVAGMIMAKRLQRVTTRDVVRGVSYFRAPETRDELSAVMASLVTLGWLEPETPSNKMRSVHAWAVHPAIFSETKQGHSDGV